MSTRYVQSGEGLFLTPRNLWNLTVQTSSIAVMATGMVLVIVMRHIDLSVGSIVAFVSTIVGVTQVYFLPKYLGLDHPAIWILTVALALAIGAPIGALHGTLVAYFGIPAFIVTLGGQLFWRGAAWWVTSGATVAPLDLRFSLHRRRAAQRFDRRAVELGARRASPAWRSSPASISAAGGARATSSRAGRCGPKIAIAVLGCFVALGATAIVNAYPLPERVAQRYAEANTSRFPKAGCSVAAGYAVPVLIALAAGVS